MLVEKVFYELQRSSSLQAMTVLAKDYIWMDRSRRSGTQTLSRLKKGDYGRCPAQTTFSTSGCRMQNFEIPKTMSHPQKNTNVKKIHLDTRPQSKTEKHLYNGKCTRKGN